MPFTTQAFARKLSDLRASFGETLGDVAAAVGIGSQALQALEAGTATPTGDEVLILADYFKCEFSWLIEDDASNPDENAAMMLRSESGRLAAADRHVIAEFMYLCKSQALLEDLLELRPSEDGFSFTTRGTFFKAHGKDCAHAFRQWHRLAPNAVIPDVYQWLRKAGLRVFRRPLANSNISGLFIRHPEAGRCILINANEDVYRQRFSAAHEAGHALMDTDRGYNVSQDADVSSADLREVRASTFASCFLMPPELLTMLGTPAQWRTPEKIIEAADRLSVSIPALLSALKRDDILDQPAITRLRDMRLHLPNKRDPELVGDFSPHELERKRILLAKGLHAEFVHQAFEAYHRHLISLAKLADILLVERSDVEELARLFGVSERHG